MVTREEGHSERLGLDVSVSMSGSPEPRHGRSESPQKKDPKIKMVFKGWRRVYSIGYATRGRVCLHTRMIRGISRIITFAEILKVVTKVPAQEEQKSLLRNTVTKECPRTGWKHCQKVKPWVCEETDPFTPCICYFDLPKKTHMPSHVKTYDGSKDLEDHLKIFQVAEKVERWAMPTWCHMFNSKLTGSARKCIKDPVEIHHIKQKEGESMKDFLRRFKIESRDVKGAPEIMRISRFMHGITNPELIKRLHDKILKSVDEMMKITTSFLRGEVAAGNQERKKSLPPWKQHEDGHKQNFKKGGFKN
ncbi:hypothetical protein Tco_0521090 [Tanacetum coccineum]